MKLKKLIYIAVIIIIIFCAAFATISGCSKTNKDENKRFEGQPDSLATEKSAQTTVSEEVQEVTTTTIEVLPENLQKLVDEADKLFAEGLYAEAVSAYRTAKGKLASASDISPELSKKTIEKIQVNAEKAKSITDTARLHYGNAMQLIYEKRIEEALLELEEALSIYPKYQDAHDALDSLKALHNLK